MAGTVVPYGQQLERAGASGVPALTGGRSSGKTGESRQGLSEAEASGPPQVPSALLTFSWDAALLEDLRAAGAEPDSSILKPELLSTIEKLS